MCAHMFQGHFVNSNTLPTISRPVGICHAKRPRLTMLSAMCALRAASLFFCICGTSAAAAAHSTTTGANRENRLNKEIAARGGERKGATKRTSGARVQVRPWKQLSRADVGVERPHNARCDAEGQQQRAPREVVVLHPLAQQLLPLRAQRLHLRLQRHRLGLHRRVRPRGGGHARLQSRNLLRDERPRAPPVVAQPAGVGGGAEQEQHDGRVDERARAPLEDAELSTGGQRVLFSDEPQNAHAGCQGGRTEAPRRRAAGRARRGSEAGRDARRSTPAPAAAAGSAGARCADTAGEGEVRREEAHAQRRRDVGTRRGGETRCAGAEATAFCMRPCVLVCCSLLTRIMIQSWIWTHTLESSNVPSQQFCCS